MADREVDAPAGSVEVRVPWAGVSSGADILRRGRKLAVSKAAELGRDLAEPEVYGSRREGDEVVMTFPLRPERTR